jgi:Protein of unknown function (DUF1360)
MLVPYWYSLALLSLAAWRTFQLLAHDEILEKPRRYLLRLGKEWEKEGDPVPHDYRVKWAVFLTCPYCAGFWIGICWYIAWQITDFWTEVVAAPMAISAILVGLAKILSQDDE